jgi:NAD-dependent SIR2 family protein deacetylase
VVLDHSGSMHGQKLIQARNATLLAARNLRRNDLFGLVVFDSTAQTVFPLQSVTNQQELSHLIERIQAGSSTNLTAGWMLGRDELKRAPEGVTRRLLLLSDGLLNVGIVEQPAVRQIVARGLEHDGIRTSCLGFGADYNEDLMSEMSRVASGQFYDAQSPEQLPAIFSAELDGLQKLAVQNLRLRIKPMDFCESLVVLGNYPSVRLPDGRDELAIGDLVSDEERVVCFALEVLPLPCIEGAPVASLAGEKLLEVEFQYDELHDQAIHSRTETRLVRIQATIHPDEVRVNEEVVSWVALQQAGKAADEVTRKLDEGDLGGAERLIQHTIQHLKGYGSGSGVADAIQLLNELVNRLRERSELHLFRKSSRYLSSHLGKMSSKDLWVAKHTAPKFKSKSAMAPPGAPASPSGIPKDLIATLKTARSVVVLTGAGISSESGIPTFRDAITGFWAQFDPQKLATPEGFAKDPALVTRWYDERRLQCARVDPNPGHRALAQWQQWMRQKNRPFALITQTVDRLHQAAGSTEVIELHGSLWVWRCVECGRESEGIGPAFSDYPPRCACGGMRRPGVVWFGEALPGQAMQQATDATARCELFLSVGTSSQVYPASSFAEMALSRGVSVVEINPHPTPLAQFATWVLTGKAGELLPVLVQHLIAD